ncbi:glycosyltransferase involved in cell wall biosynthesis [Georgenia soli]|uniref:Glycosyltransferase involved in cell wall biosynthesis n=1 Tax=Georgenia soli TaxID=638953 RepID=A0A2A9ELV1_9MICO|nr:glycosyltransferase [Georgenia soli]PFG39944.1 glycosyltransferase involved in cell wall biosynthesis [Georgenia soli]
MRIAMVSEHASPLAALGGVDAGGQNVHVAALATALAEEGHVVEVYTRRDRVDLPERVTMHDGVDVIHVPAGPPEPLPKDELPPFMPAFGRWLARRWSEEGAPDVVHSHFWMSGLAVLEATRTVRVPVVHTYHALGSVKRRYQGAADTSPPTRIRDERTIGRSVDLVVATCSDEFGELRRLGVPVSRLRVVPCGVDVEHFTPGPPHDAAAGAAGAADPGGTAGPAGPRRLPHRLLTIGRLVPRKGVATIVEALPAVPTAELVVAGGPPRHEIDTDPEVRRLTALAEDLGVADRVTFLGSVPHDDMPALIREADVVVATPWYEPFGIVPLEAAACGRPVVGAAVGGLLDSVADGVTGVLVPPQNPTALADALVPLLQDRERRSRFGTAARRRAVDLFSWTTVAAGTLAAYEAAAYPAMYPALKEASA